MVEFFGKFDLTKLEVPTRQSSPISQPLSITEFGASQQPLPTFTLPLITTPAAICVYFLIVELCPI